MNIILFGFKGCGKTHFGKLLAHESHCPFIDTDDLIVQLHGKKLPIRKIYQTLGETRFRALEKEAIRTLTVHSNTVITLGGGVVLNPDNVEFLYKVGEFVYLEASFETLRTRIFKEGPIPSFVNANDPVASLRTIYHERKLIYESIAARHVNVDLLDEAGVLAALHSIIYLEDLPNGF